MSVADFAVKRAKPIEETIKDFSINPAEKMSTDQKATKPSNGGDSSTNYYRGRQNYLEEKAKHLEMPTAKEAEMIPKYLFDDPVFIIHMCSSCRSLSRSLPAFHLDDEYQKIELKLCRICRATYNCQRRIKFFKHDLLCVKRRSDN